MYYISLIKAKIEIKSLTNGNMLRIRYILKC